MWGASFKKTIISASEMIVTFDEDGVEDDEKEIDYSDEYHLECEDCGNSSSIFYLITAIAEWEEEENEM